MRNSAFQAFLRLCHLVWLSQTRFLSFLYKLWSPYLISTKDGVGIAIYENDTPMTKKIKEFMALYGIVDVCMRMLKVNELKKIMGFPEDYVLVGTQSEQKKFIGNAVEVNMGRVLCEALCSRLAS